MFLRTDHSPNPSLTSVLAANHVVNMAVQQVALECPYLFHEELVRMSTLPELQSIDENDTVSIPTDNTTQKNWISLVRSQVETDIPTTYPDDWETGLWRFDGSYDGAMIQFTDADGNVYTNQIRSMWVDSSGYGRVSLVSPHNPATYRGTVRQSLSYINTGPFTYRIFHPFLWLPDDLVELKSMRIMGSRSPAELEIIGQEAAEQIGINDYSYAGETGGPPRWVYRRGHFQLPAPASAPTVQTYTASGASHGSNKWLGPEPYGQFKYVYTICWGKRDWDVNPQGLSYRTLPVSTVSGLTNTNHGDSTESDDSAADYIMRRHREPLFESAPSPESSAFTIADPGGSSTTDSAVVQVPHFNYMMGNWWTGTSSGAAFDFLTDGQSGLYVRVYRKRVTTDIGAGYATLGATSGATSITALKALDLPDAYFLVGEFRPDSNKAQYVDDGAIVPDYNRRLRNIHGYSSVRLHPIPNGKYDLEARVLRRPPLLEDDNDVPKIDPIAIKAIIDLATSYYYERLKDPVGSQRALNMYKESIQVITRRYADMRPASQPLRRQPARLWRPRPSYRWWGPSENS